MRSPLLPMPYRVSSRHARRKGREGEPFWRVRVYGLALRESCECDSEQDCVVYRTHGIYPTEIDEETGETFPEYDPRQDCQHRLRPPHRHTWVGLLVNRPLRQKRTDTKSIIGG